MVESGTLLQDRFLIEEPIGRGGMGAVYAAVDQKFGSRVAIKERSFEDEELAEAFEREGRLLNSLHHPILPHVSDYFSEGGRYFLVMEYIEGEDLLDLLKREGAFAAEQVVQWALELLDGLDYLHSQQPPVIHRDIKPGNLKLTSRGNIVLLDFGLAKESSGHTLGMKSVFGYSRRYSPLEQIEGTGTDARSDIFSLGATLFHLITGEPPVDVLRRASAIVAGRPDPLVPANELDDDVPSAIAAVIHSAMALNPERRFASAAAMRSALEYAADPDSRILAPVPYEAESPAPQMAEEPWLPGDAEDFAAFHAFRSDVAQEVAGFIKRNPQPSPDAAAISDPRTDSATERTERPVEVRLVQPFWQKRSVWAATLIGCLLLLTWAVFRSAASPETAPVEEPALTTAEHPVNADAVNVGGKAAIAASTETTPLEEELVAEEKEVPQGITVEARPATKNGRSNIQAAKRTEEEAKPEPVIPAVRTQPSQQPARASRTLPQRPRRVREPVFYEGVPVVEIESIFSGIPSTRERRREARRRKWEMSDEERDEIRRQRIDDLLRETRRRRPND